MEQKLSEFRTRRRREEIVNKAKETISNVLAMNFLKSEENQEEREALIIPDSPPPPARAPPPELANDDEAWNPDPEPEEDPKSRWLRRTHLALVWLLWLALLAVAYQLQLVMPYLLISALFMIYANTRTTPRKVGEPSAYSVFNPNCQAIDGTLNAEQFEREIRFGPASVR